MKSYCALLNGSVTPYEFLKQFYQFSVGSPKFLLVHALSEWTRIICV